MPLQTGPGQTAVTLDAPVAYPGLLRRSSEAVKIRTYVSSEDIPFGVLVELSSGKIRNPQTATAAGKIVGIALYRDTGEPYMSGTASNVPDVASASGWKANSLVPVLQIGEAWVPYTGTAPGATTADWATAVNFNSYSTGTSTYRGWVTATATGATSAAEVYALPSGWSCEGVNTTEGLALMSVNIP